MPGMGSSAGAAGNRGGVLFGMHYCTAALDALEGAYVAYLVALADYHAARDPETRAIFRSGLAHPRAAWRQANARLEMAVAGLVVRSRRGAGAFRACCARPRVARPAR
jgi:hypothetical protein